MEEEGNISVFKKPSRSHAFTALDDDLFGSRGYYGEEDGIHIVIENLVI